jgi:two-component system, LytTR family, sensor kinase
MARREPPGFPTFWQLQLAGWSCFCVLLLVITYPDLRHPGIARGNGTFLFSLFALSCILHRACRRFADSDLSWIALESSAVALSLPAGMIVGVMIELSTLDVRAFDWSEWLKLSSQAAIMLFLWCSLYFSIREWRQSVQERERRLRAEAQLQEARLSALRYQLNPHFLFNSLNAVSTLILAGEAEAAMRVLAQIGDVLRITLESEDVIETTLASEIAFTEEYLAIEHIRLGSRLQVEINIAQETQDLMVPTMLLQPIVENAIRHGLASRVEGGAIRIRSEVRGDRLEIIVQNSGAVHPQVDGPGTLSSGIGLTNTVERLKTLYQDDFKLQLNWPTEGGCEVVLELPFRRVGETQEEGSLCEHLS